jgi:hypothetical protein
LNLGAQQCAPLLGNLPQEKNMPRYIDQRQVDAVNIGTRSAIRYETRWIRWIIKFIVWAIIVNVSIFAYAIYWASSYVAPPKILTRYDICIDNAHNLAAVNACDKYKGK